MEQGTEGGREEELQLNCFDFSYLGCEGYLVIGTYP